MSAVLAYLIFLRLVHIVAAVCWVGGSILYFVFLEPTAKATAPGSQQFMQHLMVRRRFPIYMTVTSQLTVLAGALLYWHNSGGLQLNWITTGTGLTFSLGAALGIVALGVGTFILSPSAKQLGAVGQAIQASGQGPTSAQLAEIGRLQGTMERFGRLDIVLVVGALLAMAAARYVVL